MLHARGPLPRLAAVSPRTRRILAAAVDVIRPRGHGFDQPIDADVLREVERFLVHLPAPLRLGFPAGLWLIELGPPLFARRRTRFTRMSPAAARAYLESFQHAGRLRAGLLLGLRTLVFLAFYQHPDVLASLDVDWAGRAATLVRRRAELLA
jgi:hypothetical protein